jgi:hypothetical protein
MDTARSTTCQVHPHPTALIDPFRIFEVRRLARDAGCQYISSQSRHSGAPKNNSPLGGGAAA